MAEEVGKKFEKLAAREKPEKVNPILDRARKLREAEKNVGIKRERDMEKEPKPGSKAYIERRDREAAQDRKDRGED